MGKKLGNDYRLWIESAVAGTYNEIKGQQSLTYDRASESINTSDKNNSPYATSAPGLFNITLSLDGVADLPDTTGFTLLETTFKAQASKKFQIRKGGSAGATPADVVFEGLMNILSLPITFGQNDVVKYKTSLGCAAAPTTDALA
jgi:predicted secreted protein